MRDLLFRVNVSFRADVYLYIAVDISYWIAMYSFLVSSGSYWVIVILVAY